MNDIERTSPEDPEFDEHEPSPVDDADVPEDVDLDPDYSTEEV